MFKQCIDTPQNIGIKIDSESMKSVNDNIHFSTSGASLKFNSSDTVYLRLAETLITFPHDSLNLLLFRGFYFLLATRALR